MKIDWQFEIINNTKKRGNFKSALLDFDGTISLIREGWRDVMVPYFVDELKKAPKAEDEEILTNLVKDFVDLHTGKQTIYQCICLDKEVVKRGGESINPLQYKKEYHIRLIEKIKNRLEGLSKGTLKKEDFLVPGVIDLLNMLKKHNLSLYLASGTDENYVIDEAKLLGITEYFDGGIYGAIDEYKLFSKSVVIRNIIEINNLKGHELIGFGDGYVEIENIKDVGGFAVGVATNEETREGINKWKRKRLINAGADIIIPDFRLSEILEDHLFGQEGIN
jgi:phosphoglycolate phosphatase